MTDVFVRGGKDTQRHTEERKPCDHRGRFWGGMVASEANPRVAGNQQKLGEEHGTDATSETPEGLNSVDSLILNS